MALLLNIDTALQQASITLSLDGKELCSDFNASQKDHAAWLHSAIETLLKQSGKKISEIEAVAVSNGPGSYTGLRIGLSTAKGFCYALKIPLITVSSTELIAFAAKEKIEDLVLPMIDARRNEVFTAVYDKFMRVKYSTYALILEPGCFDHLLEMHKILFAGNAVEKARAFIRHPNASFLEITGDSRQLSAVAEQRYAEKSFADLAYSEPFYVKEFHSTAGR